MVRPLATAGIVTPAILDEPSGFTHSARLYFESIPDVQQFNTRPQEQQIILTLQRPYPLLLSSSQSLSATSIIIRTLPYSRT